MVLRPSYNGGINAVVDGKPITVLLRIKSDGRYYALFGVLTWYDIPTSPEKALIRVRVGDGPIHVIASLQINAGKVELTTFTPYEEGKETPAA
jgi:hypothetical protein